MKIRPTIDNPDSQFVAMPQTITPAGIELNPTTEPIEESENLSNGIDYEEDNHKIKQMIIPLNSH